MSDVIEQLKGEDGKPMYFYQFSKGSYSDYSVDGLYVCDHEVTEAEWDAHYAEYLNQAKRLADLIPTVEHKYFGGLGTEVTRMIQDTSTEQYKAHREFLRNVSPEDSFIAKHNMKPVGCMELWRD